MLSFALDDPFGLLGYAGSLVDDARVRVCIVGLGGIGLIGRGGLIIVMGVAVWFAICNF